MEAKDSFIAFHKWIAIGKDISKAGSVKNALGYLFGPPGWSHDGSRKTTRQLRAKAATHENQVPNHESPVGTSYSSPLKTQSR